MENWLSRAMEFLKARLGARRSGSGLRRDASATFCWTMGSILDLWDSDIPCNWNP